MAPGKAVVVYVRCSTIEQNDALQRREIQAWLKRNGVKQARWFSDKASGTNGNRPGWKKLQQAIQDGNVDTLICWRLDRLTRSLMDAANLFDWLQKKGVRLVSMTEGIDLDSITGRMVAGVLATIAQFENDVRRQRQMAGIRAAKAEGRKWGGSVKGWSKVSDAQTQRVLKMYHDGVSKTKIAKAEGLSWPTVHKIIGLMDNERGDRATPDRASITHKESHSR